MRFFPFVSREARPAPTLEFQLRSLFEFVIYCENYWRWLDYLETHTS